jgi:AhpC/TSA family
MLFRFSIRAVLVSLAISTLSCFADSPQRVGSRSTADSTAPAPQMVLSTILGQRIRWADLRGHLVLMAFLQLLPDTDSNSSRVQLQYLRSMNTQYHSRGLAIVVVDESYLVTHVQSQPDLLLNALYDLNMSELGLVPDPSGHIRAAMKVKTVPTTVLFDPVGNVIHRWSGVVLPAFLVEAIVKANGAAGQDGHPSNNNP